MPVRTGKEYIDGIKKRQGEVWLFGERIEDVTAHPAFRGPMLQLAKLFDLQHDPEFKDILTYASPETGELLATSFMPAQTHADLVKRREAFRIFAESTFGLMGRSQDFLNTALLSFAEATEVFARGGQKFADNVVSYYEYVRDNDLLLTHALLPPQTDRSKTSADQSEEFLHLGVVRETADGLILRGGRMLATLGPLADEVLVFSLPGLKDHDAKYANAFAIPVDTPGLRQICREPYDMGNSAAFDHPLSSNFEEPDTVLVFEDVLVPWERVFMYANVEHSNALYPESNLRNYTAHQTGVRGLVKMKMAVGIAMAIARAIKADDFLHVQEMLGGAINDIEIIQSCIIRAEVENEVTATGSLRPKLSPLQAVRGVLPRAYPRVIEIIQKIGAGGLMMMPTGADFASPIADDANKFYQGAGISAEERSRLFKLAWDLSGHAFGSRQLQYERYYAGDPVRILAGNYLGYDSAECDDLVRRALDLGRAG